MPIVNDEERRRKKQLKSSFLFLFLFCGVFPSSLQFFFPPREKNHRALTSTSSSLLLSLEFSSPSVAALLCSRSKGLSDSEC